MGLIWRWSSRQVFVSNKSALPENIHTLLKTTSTCCSDIRNWMTQKKPHVNSEKQKLFSSEQDGTLFDFCQPPSAWRYHSPTLWLGQKPQCSPWQHAVHGELLQSNFHIPLPALLKMLKLVTSLVLSHFNYSFSPFWCACSLSPIAFVTFKTSHSKLCCLPHAKKGKTDYITPLFESPHWLPVTLIQYRINNLL